MLNNADRVGVIVMSRTWWRMGRIIYSVPLSITGLIYLWKPKGAVESMTSFIPGELNLIYVAGFLWLIFGLFIAVNIFTKYACYGVIALSLLYQIMVHIPAVYTGEYLNVVWFELLRDLSLMGGALLIIAHVNETERHINEFQQSDEELSVY